MTQALITHVNSQQFRKSVDWAVFGIGALSLAIAIVATVVTASNDVTAQDAAPKIETVLAG